MAVLSTGAEAESWQRLGQCPDVPTRCCAKLSLAASGETGGRQNVEIHPPHDLLTASGD